MVSRTYRYRSLFWPLVLILAGVVALLVNTGALSVDRIYLLLDLWPVILIVIGLELIVRRSVHGVAGDIAAALIVLVAVGGAVVYVTVAPSSTAAVRTLDASDPAGSLTQASIEIDVGAATITVTGSSTLGSDLYRAHIRYSGSKPDVSLDSSTGKVRIEQPNNNTFGPQSRQFVLDLQLNPDVTWSIAETTGAASNKIDLSNVHLAGLTFQTGASTSDLKLGPASGIVRVELNGGAINVHVHRPSGTEASVAVSGGLVNVQADGKNLHAIGSVSYQSPGFGDARDGYRIQVNGGTCNVTLDTGGASG